MLVDEGSGVPAVETGEENLGVGAVHSKAVAAFLDTDDGDGRDIDDIHARVVGTDHRVQRRQHHVSAGHPNLGTTVIHAETVLP